MSPFTNPERMIYAWYYRFFTHANDPRFLSTLKAILRPRDREGLTENNLVYRYVSCYANCIDWI